MNVNTHPANFGANGDVLSTYCFLRSMSVSLHISPFELESYIAALSLRSAHSRLLDTIHLTLIGTLISLTQETVFLPYSFLDISLLDSFTWPEYIVPLLKYFVNYYKHFAHGSNGEFVESYYAELADLKGALSHIYSQKRSNYREFSLDCKVCIINVLVNLILSQQSYSIDLEHRESVMPTNDLLPMFQKGEDGYPEICILCGEEGSLMCCDYCPATYHRTCLSDRADSFLGNWQCYECGTPDPLRGSARLAWHALPAEMKSLAPALSRRKSKSFPVENVDADEAELLSNVKYYEYAFVGRFVLAKNRAAPSGKDACAKQTNVCLLTKTETCTLLRVLLKYTDYWESEVSQDQGNFKAISPFRELIKACCREDHLEAVRVSRTSTSSQLGAEGVEDHKEDASVLQNESRIRRIQLREKLQLAMETEEDVVEDSVEIDPFPDITKGFVDLNSLCAVTSVKKCCPHNYVNHYQNARKWKTTVNGQFLLPGCIDNIASPANRKSTVPAFSSQCIPSVSCTVPVGKRLPSWPIDRKSCNYTVMQYVLTMYENLGALAPSHHHLWGEVPADPHPKSHIKCLSWLWRLLKYPSVDKTLLVSETVEGAMETPVCIKKQEFPNCRKLEYGSRDKKFEDGHDDILQSFKYRHGQRKKVAKRERNDSDCLQRTNELVVNWVDSLPPYVFRPEWFLSASELEDNYSLTNAFSTSHIVMKKENNVKSWTTERKTISTDASRHQRKKIISFQLKNYIRVHQFVRLSECCDSPNSDSRSTDNVDNMEEEEEAEDIVAVGMPFERIKKLRGVEHVEFLGGARFTSFFERQSYRISGSSTAESKKLLKRLARCGGRGYLPHVLYSDLPETMASCPFGTTWRYRTMHCQSHEQLALQLRYLEACLYTSAAPDRNYTLLPPCKTRMTPYISPDVYSSHCDAYIARIVQNCSAALSPLEPIVAHSCRSSGPVKGHSILSQELFDSFVTRKQSVISASGKMTLGLPNVLPESGGGVGVIPYMAVPLCHLAGTKALSLIAQYNKSSWFYSLLKKSNPEESAVSEASLIENAIPSSSHPFITASSMTSIFPKGADVINSSFMTVDCFSAFANEVYLLLKSGGYVESQDIYVHKDVFSILANAKQDAFIRAVKFFSKIIHFEIMDEDDILMLLKKNNIKDNSHFKVKPSEVSAVENDSSFQCPVCGKGFAALAGLQYHVKNNVCQKHGPVVKATTSTISDPVENEVILGKIDPFVGKRKRTDEKLSMSESILVENRSPNTSVQLPEESKEAKVKCWKEGILYDWGVIVTEKLDHILKCAMLVVQLEFQNASNSAYDPATTEGSTDAEGDKLKDIQDGEKPSPSADGLKRESVMVGDVDVDNEGSAAEECEEEVEVETVVLRSSCRVKAQAMPVKHPSTTSAVDMTIPTKKTSTPTPVDVDVDLVTGVSAKKEGITSGVVSKLDDLFLQRVFVKNKLPQIALSPRHKYWQQKYLTDRELAVLSTGVYTHLNETPDMTTKSDTTLNAANPFAFKYVPQVGDDLLYYPVGHKEYNSLYPDRTNTGSLLDRRGVLRKKIIESTHWIGCRILTVDYEFPPKPETGEQSVLMVLLLGPIGGGGEHCSSGNIVGGNLSSNTSNFKPFFVLYKPDHSCGDFLVQRKLVTSCLKCKWKAGDVFEMVYDDGIAYFGTIVALIRDDNGYPIWGGATVLWYYSNTEDKVNEWELQPTTYGVEKPLDSVPFMGRDNNMVFTPLLAGGSAKKKSKKQKLEETTAGSTSSLRASSTRTNQLETLELLKAENKLHNANLHRLNSVISLWLDGFCKNPENQDKYAAFIKPVSEKIAPGYARTIPFPSMCLSLLVKRAQSCQETNVEANQCAGFYRQPQAVLGDIRTLYYNCLDYNDPHSTLCQKAAELYRTLLREATAKFPDVYFGDYSHFDRCLGDKERVANLLGPVDVDSSHRRSGTRQHQHAAPSTTSMIDIYIQHVS